MRTALLAARKTTPDDELRAALRLAGRSVLDWQVATANALRCERIAVLADPRASMILRAQHAAEAAGMQFHCLSGFARLPALLRGEDEVLMLADGLICASATLAALLGADADGRLRPLVLCLPAEAPLARAFPEDCERIDPTRCWAGALLMRAAPAQQLNDFPPDSDPYGLMLRLALQAGTPCRTLTPQESASDVWLLASDREVVQAHERAVLAKGREVAGWSSPGLALVTRITAASGARGLARGEPAGMLAALTALLAGLALAAAGWTTLALVLAATAHFALRLADSFAGLRARLLQERSSRLLAWLRDPGGDVAAALVIMLALAPPAAGAITPLAALGPLAIGTLRLAVDPAMRARAGFWQDRTAQMALLAAAGAWGALAAATALLALTALARALFIHARPAIPQ